MSPTLKAGLQLCGMVLPALFGYLQSRAESLERNAATYGTYREQITTTQTALEREHEAVIDLRVRVDYLERRESRRPDPTRPIVGSGPVVEPQPAKLTPPSELFRSVPLPASAQDAVQQYRLKK